MSKYISDGGVLDFANESYLNDDYDGKRSSIEYDQVVIDDLNNYMTERGLDSYEQRREYIVNLLNGNEEPQKNIFNVEGRRHVADGFTLNHEMAFVLDGDGNVIYGAHGDERSVSLTRGIPDGSTVIHNHPSGYHIKQGEMGGTFSIADVRAISNSNGSEIVAVGMEGTYSMKYDEDSDRQGYIRRIREDSTAVQKRLKMAHNKCEERNKNGYYGSNKQYYVDNNNSQLEVIDRYYAKTAKEYGVKYSFTPNEGIQNERQRAAIVAAQKRMTTKPETGRGSKTKVRGAYKDAKGQTYIAYKTNGKEFITDGRPKMRLSGEDREKLISESKYIGTMSSQTFVDWKAGKTTEELARKKKEGIGERRK